MKQLIEKIMALQITSEEKIEHILTVIKVAHGQEHFVTQGLYLKVVEQDNDLSLQLWYRNVDENSMTDHGNTGYSDEQILDLMHREYLNKERGIVR